MTGAACWIVLAVVCIFAPFDELADRSDFFELLGRILGGTVAKYSIALLLVAVAIYSLQARVPRRRRWFKKGAEIDQSTILRVEVLRVL